MELLALVHGTFPPVVQQTQSIRIMPACIGPE